MGVWGVEKKLYVSFGCEVDVLSEIPRLHAIYRLSGIIKLLTELCTSERAFFFAGQLIVTPYDVFVIFVSSRPKLRLNVHA